MHRTRFVPIASLALLAAATRPTHAQTFIYVSAYATCAGPDSLYVIWTAVDAAADPNAYPEFVGYDVMRRPMGECVDYVPANAEIIPRVIGTTTHYFGELTPEAGRTFEYRVRAVDQNRVAGLRDDRVRPARGRQHRGRPLGVHDLRDTRDDPQLGTAQDHLPVTPSGG